MKVLQYILKIVFWLVIIALLIAPVGLIWRISRAEMAQYTVEEPPTLREVAFGAPEQVRRADVRDQVTVSGTFVCNAYEDMELTQENLGEYRWDVGTGEEVQEGQVLAKYGEETIVSPVDGVLQSINAYGERPYLRFGLLKPVELECVVDNTTRSALRDAIQLTTVDGAPVEITFASNLKNADGTSTVRLRIESGRYTVGQRLDLTLYTGLSFPQALVLPFSCVYQKVQGEDQPWYARKVDQNGYFLEEVQLGVSYADGDIVCVTGVQEGDSFDSGYKALLQGG